MNWNVWYVSHLFVDIDLYWSALYRAAGEDVVGKVGRPKGSTKVACTAEAQGAGCRRPAATGHQGAYGGSCPACCHAGCLDAC